MLGLLGAAALSGCVTMEDQNRTVGTWKGYDVAASIPPDTVHCAVLGDGVQHCLTVLAAGNRADREGRVTYHVVSHADLVLACPNHENENAQLVACTKPGPGAPSTHSFTYDLYVDAQFPDWVQQIYLTEELGHVGQIELNAPRNHVGFTDPTIGLIQRLGG